MGALRTPYFDLNKICEFIQYSENHKIKETEIIDTIDNSLEQSDGERILKTVRDTIMASNQQVDNIRYDLVKTLLLTIIESNVDFSNEEDKFTIGEQLAINTLVKNKMLKL